MKIVAKLFKILLFLFLIGSTINLYAQDKSDKKQIKDKESLKKQSVKKQTAKKQTEKKQIPSKVESDTTKATPFAKKDTMATQPVRSNLYWYDLNNQLYDKTETASNYAYRFINEKYLQYRDMSDIFRQKPMWYHFNLMESGRPHTGDRALF